MDNGIQNHTSATAAPVIIDAVGTTPICRTGMVVAAGATLEAIATMPSTYGYAPPRNTAFSSNLAGITPRLATSAW